MDTNKLQLVIATTNHHKVVELSDLFAGSGLDMVGLEPGQAAEAPEENGASFEDNARIKAEAYAARTGGWVLADDSGLVVPALNGAPGIYSARYAGEGANDADNRRKLLSAVAEKGLEDPAAMFVCCICVGHPRAPARIYRGEWHGTICAVERGARGFGYDPVFIPRGRSQTAAELQPAEKNRLSHRALAAAACRKGHVEGEWGANFHV